MGRTWLALEVVTNPTRWETGMAQQRCEHSKRVTGILEFDFCRPSDPSGLRYSAPVSVAVCEECGHIQLHSKMPTFLCDWLRGADRDEI